MKFDKDLLRTVLFAVGVVAMVIGIYQTLLFNDLLRNYWIYEGQAGKVASPSRSALAQGMWPRFPGMAGASAVRMNAAPDRTATAALGNRDSGDGEFRAD